MKTISAGLMALILIGCGGASDKDPAPAPPPTKAATVPAYESIKQNGPVVILLAASAHDALYGGIVESRLRADALGAGFTLVSIDLPCHGADAEEIPPLSCWARRIANGDSKIFSNFCAELSAVIDSLGVSSVSVIGQSRGGYLASYCAARDVRMQNLVLLAPVTDLRRLTEFSAVNVDQTIFGLDQYAGELQTRNALVRIGNADDRVGTDAAISFANKIGATLQILDVIGHTAPEDGSTTAFLLAATSP